MGAWEYFTVRSVTMRMREMKEEKRILLMFKNRPNRGYSAGDVEKKTKIQKGKVSSILNYLYRQGVLGKIRYGIKVIYYLKQKI